MADINAIFGSIILLVITYPATLTAWWLLFPDRVEGARQQISDAPRKSFGLGLAAAALAAIPALVFFNLPSQFTQVLGWIWLVLIIGWAGLGAAGLAAELGLRINWKNDGGFQSLGAFIRGAVVLTLASIFPIIGWLLIIPGGTLLSLGAITKGLRSKKSKSKKEKKAA